MNYEKNMCELVQSTSCNMMHVYDNSKGRCAMNLMTTGVYV